MKVYLVLADNYDQTISGLYLSRENTEARKRQVISSRLCEDWEVSIVELEVDMDVPVLRGEK